ncbi:MAG: ribosome-associated translation inhibitor RaiA [Saprospiraceae bacterium]|nr:ribosome-associated translation inhibitor RaiA [Saprospiraceae bacterium]
MDLSGKKITPKIGLRNNTQGPKNVIFFGNPYSFIKIVVFMEIRVQSLHFHADEKLVSYATQKLSRLERFFDRITAVDVFFKLQEKGGRIHEKIAEIRLMIPGGYVLDKKTAETFEAAVDMSIDTLKRQLKRVKEKRLERA